MIFQSSFSPFSFFVLPPSVCICTKDLTFFRISCYLSVVVFCFFSEEKSNRKYSSVHVSIRFVLLIVLSFRLAAFDARTTISVGQRTGRGDILRDLKIFSRLVTMCIFVFLLSSFPFLPTSKRSIVLLKQASFVSAFDTACSLSRSFPTDHHPFSILREHKQVNESANSGCVRSYFSFHIHREEYNH